MNSCNVNIINDLLKNIVVQAVRMVPLNYQNPQEGVHILLHKFLKPLTKKNYSFIELKAITKLMKEFYVSIAVQTENDPNQASNIEREYNSIFKEINTEIENHYNLLMPSYSYDGSKKLSLTNDTTFIPILKNPSLNQRLYTRVKANFIKNLLAVPTIKSSLSDNVRAITDSYIKELILYLGSSYTGPTDLETLYNNSIAYNNLLNLVANIINHKITADSRIRETKNNQPTIRAIEALYVLNNFDEVLEHFSSNFLFILPSKKGKINFDPDKYIFKQKGVMNKGFDKEDLKSDGENVKTRLFELIWCTIPNGKGSYLTKKDLDFFIKEVHNYFNQDRNPEITLSALKEILNIGNLFKYSKEILTAINTWELEYKKNFKKSKSASYRQSLEHYYNFVETLLYLIHSKQNTSYLQINSSGVDLKNPAIYSTPKIGVYSKLEQTIKYFLLENPTHNPITYSNLFYYSKIDPRNKIVLRYINSITGLNINEDTYKDMINSENLSTNEKNIEIIQDFLKFYTKEVEKLKVSLRNVNVNGDDIKTQQETKLKKVVDTIKGSQQFLLFSNLLTQNSFNTIMKVTDLQGNQQPNNSIPNNFIKLYESARQASSIFTKNALTKSDSALLRREDKWNDAYCLYTYRQDVAFGDRVVKADQLTPEETAYAAFNYEFIDSIVKLNTYFTQPLCYADKTKIGLLGINANSQEFKNLTLKELPGLLYEQRKEFYTLLENSIKERFKNVGLNPSNPYDAINADPDKYISKLREGIDYIVTKDANGNTKYAPNAILQHYIKSKDSFNDFDNLIYKYEQKALKEWLEVSQQLQIPDLFKSDAYLDNNLKALSQIFEIDNEQMYNAFKNFIKNSNTWGDFDKKFKNTKAGFSILTKFFYLDNYFSEAFMYVSGNHYTSYAKSGTINMTTIGSTLHKNMVTGTKRHNYYSATYLAPSINTYYGVKRYSKYLVIEDMKQLITNYYGDEHLLDVIDGGIMALGFLTIWEQNSYPEVDYNPTMKTIGLMSDKFTMRLIKCALFSLNNAIIRNSFSDTDKKGSSALNFATLAKILMRSGDLTKHGLSIFDAVQKNSDYNLNIGTYIKRGDVFFQFKDLNIIEDNGRYYILTNWVNEFGDLHKIKRPLNSTLNLWEAFGAEYSYSKSENGDFYLSEASMENTALFISECCPEVKEEMCTKLVPITAMKTGVENVHSFNYLLAHANHINLEAEINKLLDELSSWEDYLESLTDPVQIQTANKNIEILKLALIQKLNDLEMFITFPELNPITWDNTRIGIQQDYGHTADDSEITTLTLLINNVAFDGKNRVLVNQIWDTLSYYIESSLKKYDFLKRNKDLKDVHKDIATFLMKRFEQGVSTANIEYLLQEAIEGKGLVISDLSIFYKFASDLVSKLNHTSIRSTMKGIAIIQNPSHGVIGVYEDINGNVSMSSNYNKLTEEQKNALYSTKEISVKLLEMGDVVLYIDKENNTQQVHIKNVYDLIELKLLEEDNIQLYKVYGVKRNLKSPSVTYTINGENVSFWSSNCVMERWGAELAYKKDPDDPENIKNYYLTKDWFMANLEALSKGYIYLTKLDFIDKKLTPIENYKYTPGELLLPKVYKTVYGLSESDTLQDVLDTKEAFFLKQLDRQFAYSEEDLKDIHTNAIKEGKQPNTMIFNYALYSVFYSSNTKPSNAQEIILSEDNTIIEDGVLWYSVNGEKLFVVDKINTLQPTLDLFGIKSIFKKNTNYIVPKLDSSVLEENESGASVLFINDKGLAVPTSQNLLSILNKFNKFNYSKVFKENSKNPLSYIKRKLAQLKYLSFVHSLDTVSVRIPTQAFQSFMRNKTVGFTDFDTNDGYINLMQIWFTGGDYDIDKSYTLMYEVNRDGILATTSNIADLSTEETLNDSFDLPLPDSNKVIVIGNSNPELEDLILEFIKEYNDEELKKNLNLKFLRPLQIVAKYLQKLDGIKEFSVSENFYKAYKNTINLFNRHNQTKITSAGIKNRIANGLIRCSGDIRNLKASLAPMSSDYWNDLIEEVESKDMDDKIEYNIYNPMSKWRIQSEAIIGKGNVGICANGIKVDSVLQQYYNNYYAKWDGSSEIDSTYNLNMNIDLTIDGVDILNKHFVKLGNVILDTDETKAFNKFKELYKQAKVTVENEKDYKLLLSLLSPGTQPQSSKEKKLIDLWNYFKSIGEVKDLNKEDYLRFLFLKEKFDVSVADNLSIFISLAVDNMKEMKLSKLYCTQDVLKLPLALIMLGADPYDVVLFCKKVLKPLVKALSVNRFHGLEKLSLEEILSNEEKRKISKDTPEGLFHSSDMKENARIATQLKKLLSFANQCTVLSSLFKINLGIPATYNELSLNLAKIVKSLQELFSDLDINLYELFVNKNEELIQEYKKKADPKGNGFNIIDVLQNSKHFYAMHAAMQKTLRNLQNTSARAASLLYMYDKIETNSKKFYGEKLNRKLQYLYDYFIIGETLKNMPFLQFTKEGIEKSLGVELNELLTVQHNDLISMHNNKDLEIFITIMDKYIIPRLQKLYPDNYAIKSLTLTQQWASNRVGYDLPFDMFNTSNVEEQDNIRKAVADFSLIADSPSGLVTVTGDIITIVDALTLYQMLLKRDSLSAFKAVLLENSENSIINKVKQDTIKLYDEIVFDDRDNPKGITNPKLKYLIENVELQKAAKDKNLQSARYDLNNALVWTFVLPKASTIETHSAIEYLRNLANNFGETIEENVLGNITTITSSNGFTYTLPTYGNVSYSQFNELYESFLSYQANLQYIKNINSKNQEDIKQSVFEKLAKQFPSLVPHLNLDVYLYNEVLDSGKFYLLKYNKANIVEINHKNGSSIRHFNIHKNANAFDLLQALLNYHAGSSLSEHIKYLKDIFKLDAKNIQAYSDYYLNNNITKLDLHNAQVFLTEHIEYIDAKDSYYKDKFEDEEDSNLKQGDIVLMDDGKEYYFMGTDAEIMYFVDLLGNVKKTLIESNIFSTKKLRVAYGYKFPKPVIIKNNNNWHSINKDTYVPLLSTLKYKHLDKYLSLVYKYPDTNLVVFLDENGDYIITNSNYLLGLEFIPFPNVQSVRDFVILTDLPFKLDHLKKAYAGDLIVTEDDQVYEFIGINPDGTITVIDQNHSTKILDIDSIKKVGYKTMYIDNDLQSDFDNDNYLKYNTLLEKPPVEYTIGDIIIRGNYKCKIISKFNNKILIKVLNPDDSISIQNYEYQEGDSYYTTNKKIIHDDYLNQNDVDETLQLNPEEVGQYALAFIDKLQEKGIRVVYDTDSNAKARVEGNTIFIPASNKKDILALTLHEFTHIALANLKRHDHNLYLRLLEWASGYLANKVATNSKLAAALTDIEASDNYNSRNEILEELLIRYLDELYKNTPDFWKKYDKKEDILSYAIKKSFESLGIKNSESSSKYLIENLDITDFLLDTLDIDAITQDTILNTVINSINVFC